MNAIQQQKESILKQLAKIDNELDKNRTTVMVDGWQTMRHARKARNWDYYAQRKRDLQDQLADLEEQEENNAHICW